MANVPKHMHALSKIYWEIVEGLKKNGFTEELAQNVVSLFFTQFTPLPRKSVKEQ